MSTEVIVIDNTAIVTTEVDYYVPINYGAQGPEGPAGPQGPAGPNGPQGPAGPIGTLSGALVIGTFTDVDLTASVDGALLVYNAEQGKWLATLSLTKQTLDCGQY